MTTDEAKEILIEAMNYMAYRETNHSLWDSDKNKLFGSDHYKSDRPVFETSAWGQGEEFEKNMTDLFRSAFLLAPPSSRCEGRNSHAQNRGALSEPNHQAGRFLKTLR
jgi:hypothetical protein